VRALLTDEQEMLAAAVDSMTALRIRNPKDLESFDMEKAWMVLRDSGLLALRDRHDGRPLASGVDAMIVAERLGGMLSPVPWVPSAALASELLSVGGAEESFVESILDGSSRPALILEGDLSRLASIDLLEGSVAWGGPGPAICLAGSSTDGWLLAISEKSDLFPRAATAAMTGPIAPAAGEVGAPSWRLVGQVFGQGELDRWTALALTLVSADCAGAMRVAVHDVVDYAKKREAFGAPIASFQAIQHMCADAFTACEGAVGAVGYAAWGVDEMGADDALLAASVAKAWICSTARPVMEAVMQVYGGIGQTWEHAAHVHARRALLDAALFGDEDIQLDRIDRLARGAL
jgi:alkylation response protein AidB-like acyl-CoA dehydrogenase